MAELATAMAEPTATVRYGVMNAPVIRTTVSFEVALALAREAIAREGLWLIHEINPQALLAKEGHTIPPVRQLLFFHPRYMVRLLAGDPSAVIEAPLKIVIMQDTGGAVFVRASPIADTMAKHPRLAELATELDAICGRIVAVVSAPASPASTE